MNEIRKTIKREVNDRRRVLIWSDSFVPLSIIGFIIIFCLETYFYNKTGDPDVTYITGMWTWIYGLWLAIFIYRRRASRKRFRIWLNKNNKKIEEELIISDDSITYRLVGYSSTAMHWTSIGSFKEHKKTIEIILAGLQLLIPKEILSDDEIKDVLKLLKQKKSEQSNSGNSVPSSPAS